jgi:hypothetical protein
MFFRNPDVSPGYKIFSAFLIFDILNFIEYTNFKLVSFMWI